MGRATDDPIYALWEADEVDGYHRPRRPLASLHANPAHSALRRARCFDHAWTALSAHFDHVECAITHRAVYRQIGDAADATMAVLWSVR